MTTQGRGTRRSKGRSWLTTCDLSYLNFFYFEFDAFVLLDPCGVNLDDLNISLHGFIPLICKFGQSGRGQDLGPCVGFTAREEGGQGRTVDKLLSQKDNLGHNLTPSVGDALMASPAGRRKPTTQSVCPGPFASAHRQKWVAVRQAWVVRPLGRHISSAPAYCQTLMVC
jgi:hypothetical protein